MPTDKDKNNNSAYGEGLGEGFGEAPIPDFAHQTNQQTPQQIIEKATYDLERMHPEYSAHTPLSMTIKFCLLGVFSALIYLNIAHGEAAIWLNAFLCSVLALQANLGLYRRARKAPDLSTPPRRFPTYTILLPLFDEAHMIKQLLENMQNLNYPKDKLQILLLVEEKDAATIAAAQTQVQNFSAFGELRILQVPSGEPQTKPRACNYGLHFARGELLIIYDAEDTPDPLQLQEAVTAFENLGSKYACLQAPLIIHDTHYDMLGHILGLEYDTLFRQYLPELARLDLPIPLGGTSNHFRTAVLKSIYGWDAFNVTEDADIGIRLREEGYRTDTLFHGTYETSTIGLRAHINQRTRWQKGNIQTWLVRLRRPRRTMSKIGVVSYLYFQFIFISRSFAPIIYLNMMTVFLGILIADTSSGALFPLIAFAGIAAVFISHIGCAIKLRRTTHIFYLPFLIIFWIFSTFIFFRALLQLILDPFKWDKTPHHTI